MAKRINDFIVDPNQLKKLNEILLQDDFQDRINEVRKVNVTITQKPLQAEVTIPGIISNQDLLLENLEEIRAYDLNPIKGNIFSENVAFAGYDESKFKFLTLEGNAYITCHSIINYVNEDVFPICKITFYFYTKSKRILDDTFYIKYSDDQESDSNRDYAVDRNQLIETYSLTNTIQFIDGPMIGGNITSYSLKLIDRLHQKNIIPIFFVKNSDSNMVVDNILQLKNRYNSDLHWSFQLLKMGQRSNLFKYIDRTNPKNTKLFCYIKPFNHVTPQRVEFHPLTYELFNDYFEDIFDMIYYLLLVHGDKSNPQIRPIAIAEVYAREVIRTVNLSSLLRNSSLIQTMDQTRFGG